MRFSLAGVSGFGLGAPAAFCTVGSLLPFAMPVEGSSCCSVRGVVPALLLVLLLLAVAVGCLLALGGCVLWLRVGLVICASVVHLRSRVRFACVGAGVRAGAVFGVLLLVQCVILSRCFAR